MILKAADRWNMLMQGFQELGQEEGWYIFQRLLHHYSRLVVRTRNHRVIVAFAYGSRMHSMQEEWIIGSLHCHA
jgi:hypothetical protein